MNFISNDIYSHMYVIFKFDMPYYNDSNGTAPLINRGLKDFVINPVVRRILVPPPAKLN